MKFSLNRIINIWFLTGVAVILTGLSKLSTAAHYAKYPLLVVWSLGFFVIFSLIKDFHIKKNVFIIPITVITGYFLAQTFLNTGVLIERRSEAFLLVLLCLPVYAGTRLNSGYEKKCWVFILGMSSILSLYAVMQYINMDFLSGWNSRDAISTFANQNFFGQFLVITIPITAGFAIQNSRKWIWLLSFFVQVYALLLTKYRTGYLAVILMVFITCIYLLICKTKYLKKWLGQGSLITLVIITGLYAANIKSSKFRQVPVINQLRQVFNISGIKSNFRILAWQGTLNMIIERPLSGHGVGSFVKKYPVFDRGAETGVYIISRTRQAHNEYLQVAAETGVVGLGLILWFICAGMFLPLCRKISPHDWCKILAWIGLWFTAIFSFPLHLPVPLAFLFILTAWICNNEEKTIEVTPQLNWKFFVSLIIVVLLNAVLLKPFVSDIEYNYGNAFKNARAYKDASQHYKKSLYLWKVMTDAENNLGIAALKSNQYDEAFKLFKDLKKTEPYGYFCRVNLAVEYLRRKEYGASYRESRAAWILSPHHPKTVELHKYIRNQFRLTQKFHKFSGRREKEE